MPVFPESELIISEAGRIYHLDLHPSEIAPIVITVGDPGRVSRVSRHFDRIDVQVQKREFVTHTGWIGNQRLTVISSGIGPDNIDIVLNELDALVNIDFTTRQPREQLRSLDIIRIGTTGGLQSDIPVDSFVVSRFAVGLDNMMHFYQRPPTLPEAELYDDLRDYLQHAGQLPTEPYVCEAHRDLVSAVAKKDLYTGITLTCPGFYGPQGRRLRAGSALHPDWLYRLSQFRHKKLAITNLEMESAAIFGLARLLGHRATSCNAIIANRANQTFSTNPKQTVDRLIETVLERIT